MTRSPIPAPALSAAALLVTVVAVALPWLSVAGRTRNGLDSAQLLVSVAEAGAPEGLRVMGLLWYAGALVALVAWGAGMVTRHRTRTLLAAGAAAFAWLCWVVFVVWAGTDDRVLVRWPGPIVGLVGAALLSLSLTRHDHSG